MLSCDTVKFPVPRDRYALFRFIPKMDTSTDPTTLAADVPPGYAIGTMPDGRHYLVPDFMIGSTDLALNTQSMMRSFSFKEAPGGVSISC
jgi:hypothetical protein